MLKGNNTNVVIIWVQTVQSEITMETCSHELY